MLCCEDSSSAKILTLLGGDCYWVGLLCPTHTWTISGPGLSVSVNSITIIMEVVYLEFTQNEYHHHHQDHHHGSHNQQPECGYGVSCPQDDLCIYIWISVMITTQITEAVLTGYVDMGETIIGSFCLFSCLVCLHHHRHYNLSIFFLCSHQNDHPKDHSVMSS